MKYLLLCSALLSAPALAWGPHPDITRAALETLGPDAAIVQQLGAETNSLRNNSCMPDWRRSLHRDKQAWFYADDYLLFPVMPKHIGHMCPEVKQTYEPFFRRALQALRTENAVNASRWVGSLVHFVEDTGAPPHAAIVSGELHKLTENWANPERLHIAGYRPRSLGSSDDEALACLLRRIDGLIEFSKQRYERAKPLAVSGERAKADPILIESAEECARVVADLLLTLGERAAQTPAGQSAGLSGKVTSLAVAGLDLVPAKIVLVGTAFSTLADGEGRYAFSHLPPGAYTLGVVRAGNSTALDEVTLPAGRTVTRDLALAADPVAGNLLRNAAFNLRWLEAGRPDGWLPNKLKNGGQLWEGETLPLQTNAHYRLLVAWQDKAEGKLVLRIYGAPPATKPIAEFELKAPVAELDLAVTPEMRSAMVVLHAKDDPGKVCRHIAFVQQR